MAVDPGEAPGAVRPAVDPDLPGRDERRPQRGRAVARPRTGARPGSSDRAGRGRAEPRRSRRPRDGPRDRGRGHRRPRVGPSVAGGAGRRSRLDRRDHPGRALRAGYAQFAFIAMGTQREALRTRVVLQRTGTATATQLGNAVGWIRRIVPRAMAHGHEPMVLPGPRMVRAPSGGAGSRGRSSRAARGRRIETTLDDECWAPASESSPKRSTIWLAASRGRGRCVWRVDRSISSRSRPTPRSARAGSRTCGRSPRGAEDVGRVGVLGHEAQGLLLAAAADHDRDPGA